MWLVIVVFEFLFVLFIGKYVWLMFFDSMDFEFVFREYMYVYVNIIIKILLK